MSDLKLPVDLFDVARIVAEEFKLHEPHARDRACVDVAEYLQQRAKSLRDTPTLNDPLAWALTQRCHTQDGVVHAAPHVVAAAAYEAVAVLLSLGDPTRALDLAGHDRTSSDASGTTRNATEHLETEVGHGA